MDRFQFWAPTPPIQFQANVSGNAEDNGPSTKALPTAGGNR